MNRGMVRSGRWLIPGLLLLCIAGCQQRRQVFAVRLSNLPPAGPHLAPVALARSRAGCPPALFRRRTSRRGMLTRGISPRGIASRRLSRNVVDINHAAPAQLADLGISARLVARILAGRPYRSKRQLLSRGLLSPARYARLKARLIARQRP